MKKKLAGILLLLSLLCTAACGKAPEKPADPNATTTVFETTVTGTAPTETTTTSIYDEIADPSFEGQTFTILCRTDMRDEIYSEGETGDVYGDAIFARNRAVEENLGIKLDHIHTAGNWSNRDNFMNRVSSTILSGDDDWQLITGYMSYMPGMVTKGLFIDINTLPSLSLDSPWWIQGYNDNVTIHDKMYTAMGDLCSTGLKNAYCGYVNIDLLETYGHKVEELYDAVNSGTWTLDMVLEIAGQVSTDLNGDGKYDAGDLHGIAMSDVTMSSLPTAFGINYTTKNAEGIPEISIHTERFLTSYERIYEASHSNFWHPVYDVEKFVEGRTLFLFHTLETSGEMKDMVSDYAVLPMPKYDAEQENYRTATRAVASILLVPNTVQNLDLCGAAMESLNFESYMRVTPAYYETVLQLKQVRDEGSQQMVRLVRESLYFDFGYVYSDNLGSISGIMRKALTNPNITSQIKGNVYSWEKSLEILLKFFEK